MFIPLARTIRGLCLLYWLLVSPALHAATEVIDRIDITQGTGESVIHIHFNIPISYKSHAPQHSGDLLSIFVDPLPSPGSAVDVLVGNETLQWSPDKRVPLFEVVYEGQGFGSATINLRFQREVTFEIQNPADVRTLDVIVRHPPNALAGPIVRHPPNALAGPIDRRPPIAANTRPATSVAAPAVTGGLEAAPSTGFPYVINLASSIQPFSPASLPQLDEFKRHRLYTTLYDKKGKTWHRLRLGFFETGAGATVVMNRLKGHYPQAWVAKASTRERMQSGETRLLVNRDADDGIVQTTTSGEPSAALEKAAGQELPVSNQPQLPAVSNERLDTLMEDARQMMTAQDYSGAIRIYTRLSQPPRNQYSQDALEFLGLARERKGQRAHARLVYEQYLEQYPDAEGTERVKQRLAALVTATKQPRDKLRAVRSGTGKQASLWDVFGGFSQYYRRNESTTAIDEDDELTTVTQSSLDSNLDITGRLRSGDNDIRTRLTGGYLHDFLDDGVNSDTSVSSLYLDAQNRKRDLSMRLGRQSRSSGGVLGRFDGLLLGLPLGKKFSVSAVGGYPVTSSTDNIETDRYFYGLTLASSGFARGWDANVFAIEQRIEGLIDRRAIGGELRYFDSGRSFFSLLDYDIHYHELNIGQFLGNWVFPDKTTLNLTLDYRNSPVLTTKNALIGQTVDSIDSLQDLFKDNEIHDLARDRTATSRLATLGIARPINDKLQLSGDVTATNLSGTHDSGGVLATEGTGTDFFYNLQLIGSNLVKSGDITILGLRYTDTDDRDISSLTFNTRYPFTRDLRINPRMTVDYRQNRNDDTDQLIYRPSLRLSYQARRRLRLEAEVGGEYSDREIVDGSEQDRSYFFNLGYRSDF